MPDVPIEQDALPDQANSARTFFARMRLKNISKYKDAEYQWQKDQSRLDVLHYGRLVRMMGAANV